MNQIEECVYTLTDDANSLAAELYDTLEAIRYDPVGATPDELYDTLEAIRYDPVGATPDDVEYMKEIRGLLRQALDRAKKIEADVGKG